MRFSAVQCRAQDSTITTNSSPKVVSILLQSTALQPARDTFRIIRKRELNLITIEIHGTSTHTHTDRDRQGLNGRA